MFTTEAVSSRQRGSAFTISSAFGVNKLQFHLNGAPSICQHILRIESGAGLASAHLSHRLSLISSSPHSPSPEDTRSHEPEKRGAVGEVGGEEREREEPISVFIQQFTRLLKGPEDEVTFYFLVKSPTAARWTESKRAALLPS